VQLSFLVNQVWDCSSCPSKVLLDGRCPLPEGDSTAVALGQHQVPKPHRLHRGPARPARTRGSATACFPAHHYLAAELGPEKQVRVNAISAGPIRTLASSAIGGILEMIHNVEEKAPLRRTVTQEEVGSAAAFLASPLASGITGQVIYVDAGYCITGM